MNNLPKLVLFDIGDVLIDYSKSFETASKEQGVSREYFDNGFDKYDIDITRGHITPNDLYARVIEENKLDIDPQYDFLQSWIRDYQSIEPTYKFLKEISDSYKIGLLSNIYKGITPNLILCELIPDIEYSFKFLSCEIGYIKPEKEIYEEVEKVTSLRGSEIFFLDDRESFLEVPKKMGWGTFQFEKENREGSIEKLRQLFGIG